MPEYEIQLTDVNIKAAEDALRVFDLYDLEHDKSYPFLNERKWRRNGPDFTYDDWGKKVEHISPMTYQSFMLINEMGVMKAKGMGYAVAVTLRKALSCLTDRWMPLVVLATAGPIIYIGCRDEAAIDSGVYLEVAFQTIILLLQDRSGEVIDAMKRGPVRLLPPNHANDEEDMDEEDMDEEDMDEEDMDALLAPIPQEQFNWLTKLQHRKYVDALLSGMPAPGEALMIFSEPDSPEPAALIAPNILAQHEAGFRARCYDETGMTGLNEDERQGYVDALALYMTICFAVANEIPLVLADTSSIPGYERLPFGVRANASFFVGENLAWAAKVFRREDLYDGRNFMNELVKKIAADEADPSYQRGTRTARDTLLLYVDFIIEFS